MRVLEIGCGPGSAARAVAHRIGDGHILAIDRSAKAIRQARESSKSEIASGRTSVPELQERALQRIARALVPGGKLFIDGGDPLQEIKLDRGRV